MAVWLTCGTFHFTQLGEEGDEATFSNRRILMVEPALTLLGGRKAVKGLGATGIEVERVRGVRAEGEVEEGENFVLGMGTPLGWTVRHLGTPLVYRG